MDKINKKIKRTKPIPPGPKIIQESVIPEGKMKMEDLLSFRAGEMERHNGPIKDDAVEVKKSFKFDIKYIFKAASLFIDWYKVKRGKK